jgi:hypothetical protein
MGGVMTRKILGREELESWLTAELRKFEECEDCEVVHVIRLRIPDKAGCNWSRTVTIRGCTEVAREILRPAFEKVMAKARSKFNLK